MLNPILLLALSTMLVFPIIFSGLAINPKISLEEGIVLGTVDNFGGNLKVFDVSKYGSKTGVEFTVFPGQETYYRDFMEVTNKSSEGRRYRIRLLESEGIAKMGLNLAFGETVARLFCPQANRHL